MRGACEATTTDSVYGLPTGPERRNYRAGVFVFVLVTGLFGASAVALAEVKILSVSAPSGDALRSAARSDFVVDVSYKTPQDTILHLWIEEYPSGSGCG